MNTKIYQILKQGNIYVTKRKFTKIQRLRWFIYTGNEGKGLQIIEQKLKRLQRANSPQLRKIDQVMMDTRRLGIEEWRKNPTAGKS